MAYRSTCYSTGRRGLITPGLASPARRRSVSKTADRGHYDNIFDRANSPTFQISLFLFVHIFCELCGRYAANVIVVYICFPTGAGEICTGAGELYRRWRDLYWRWRDLYWRWRVVPALARSVPAIWPRGKQPQGYLTSPGKPLCTLLTEGAGGP